MATDQNNRFKWQYIDRLIIVLTFICLAISTRDTSSVAEKTIDQISNDLRPWIVVEKVNTYLHADNMEAKYQLVNVGKIPAYVTAKTEGHLNGDLAKHENLEASQTVIAVMPTQVIHKEGLVIRGDTFRQIQNKTFEGEITQTIKIRRFYPPFPDTFCIDRIATKS